MYNFFSKHEKTVNFSEIFSSKERLVLIFPENFNQALDDLKQSARIFQKFKSTVMFFDSYSYNFFKKYLKIANVRAEIIPSNNHIFSTNIQPAERTVVINLNKDKTISRNLKNLNNTAIVSVSGNSNIDLLPLPYNTKNLIDVLLGLLNIEDNLIELINTDNVLKEEIRKEPPKKVKHFYPNLKNSDLFIFMILKRINCAYINNYLKEIDSFHGASYIFLNSKIKTKNENVDYFKLQEKDILKIFNIAKSSNLFLTDNLEFIEGFNKFLSNCYFVEKDLKKNTQPNLFNTVDASNINQIKRLIQSKKGIHN